MLSKKLRTSRTAGTLLDHWTLNESNKLYLFEPQTHTFVCVICFGYLRHMPHGASRKNCWFFFFLFMIFLVGVPKSAIWKQLLLLDLLRAAAHIYNINFHLNASLHFIVYKWLNFWFSVAFNFPNFKSFQCQNCLWSPLSYNGTNCLYNS